MKKLIAKIVILKLGLAGAILFSGVAFGGQSVNVDVVMTIQNVSVARIGSGDIGVMVIPGGSRVTDRSVYKNDGNGPEHFMVKVAQTSGNWTLVKTVPGVNEYRLSSIFHHWNLKPTTDEFQDNDILIASDQTSTDKVFFNDNETHKTDAEGKNSIELADQRGSNVPTLGERNLYIKFDAPSSSTVVGDVKASITVSAIAVP